MPKSCAYKPRSHDHYDYVKLSNVMDFVLSPFLHQSVYRYGELSSTSYFRALFGLFNSLLGEVICCECCQLEDNTV